MTIETSVADKVGRWDVRRPSNVNLLYVARAVRGFGDGFAVIILPAYLTELGFSTLQVGLDALCRLFRLALRLAQPTLDQRIDHDRDRRGVRKCRIVSASRYRRIRRHH